MSLLYRFGTDERGSVTVWNIVWFLVFVIFAGIGIDTANGYRIKTMLQHTADASAHAGVISLPDEADALATAETFAATNMPNSLHGIPVPASNVEVGVWTAGGGFIPSTGAGVNAVKVSAARTEAQQNALGTQLLQVIGLDFFNINAEAVAVSGVNGCLQDGIVAMGKVDIQSNNDVLDEICFHGQGKDGIGIDLQNNNTFECGVRVSMKPNLSDYFKSPESSLFTDADGYTEKPCDPGLVPDPYSSSSNDGLYEALMVQDMFNLELEICNQLNIVMSYVDPVAPPEPWRFLDYDGDGTNDCATEDFTQPDFTVLPHWMRESAFDAGTIGNPVEIKNTDFEALDLTLAENQNKLYFVTCTANGGKNGTLELEGVIENIAIVTECRVDGKKVKVGNELEDDPDAKALSMSNVLLMSTAVGQNKKDPADKNTITFPGNAEIGTAVCSGNGTEAEGSVRIYGLGSIKFPASGRISGAQIVVEGDIEMAADAGIDGINALAGGDITYTSNAKLAGCPAGNDGSAFTTRQYRVAS